MLLCLMDRDGRIKAHPKISKKTLAIRDMGEGRGADPSIWPSSKSIRHFLPLTLAFARRAATTGACLFADAARARPVQSVLLWSNPFGAIFAASRRRAEE
jgi:hypothetical protein